MTQVHLFGDWKGQDIEDLEHAFCATPAHFAGDTLVGIYTYRDYSGDALGFVQQGGEFFEFGGAHCSCYGLEGQGDLSLVSRAYIVDQLQRGKLLRQDRGIEKHDPKQWSGFVEAVKAMVKS